MNDNFWTAIRIPEVIEANSEYGTMYARFPQHTVLTNSEGETFGLICTSPEEPIDAIYPVLTEDNTLRVVFDGILAHLSGYTQSAILDKGLASMLFNEFIAPTLDNSDMP